jgi:hypothetical protein
MIEVPEPAPLPHNPTIDSTALGYTLVNFECHTPVYDMTSFQRVEPTGNLTVITGFRSQILTLSRDLSADKLGIWVNVRF